MCVAASDAAANAPMTKLVLNSSNVINGFGLPMGGGASGEPYLVLDEQEAAGDPANGMPGQVQTQWMPGYTQWAYPETFLVVDLGGPVVLNAVWGWRKYGKPAFVFSVGKTPFPPYISSWTVDETAQWPCQSWKGFNLTLSTTVNYLIIQMTKPANIFEIVLYGKRQPSPRDQPALKKVQNRQRPTMLEMMGVNAFADDPIERISGLVGTVREYQEWVFTEGPSSPGFPHAQNMFSPTNVPGIDLDKFYNVTHAAGIQVHQTLMNRAYFLYKGNETRKEWAPLLDHDINPLPIANLSAIVDPASYIAIAAHAFQVAARYGSVRLKDESLLQLAPGQRRISGLGIMSRLEVLNEPNRWWCGRQGFMTPEQIAAMASAAYDGHEGTLGVGIGAKTADPSFELVLAAVTGTGRRNLDYMKMILAWSKAFRKDKKFPADVLNFHGYGVSDDEQSSDDKSPEELDMEGRLKALVAWRDAHVPQVAVWDTEFGWDTDQRSTNRAPAYGPWSGEDVQAMWHVRGFMAAAAAGMDRMQIYMLRDVQPSGAKKFLTSGLTSCKQQQWQPKRSWYTVHTLTTLIGPMRFVYALNASAITAVAPDTPTTTIKAYKFAVDASEVEIRQRAGQAVSAVVVWSASKSGKVVEHVRLVVADSACPSQMTRAELVMNSTNGDQFPLHPSATATDSCVVTIAQVTEMPTILLLGAPPRPRTGPVPPLTPPPNGMCKDTSGKALPNGIYCAGSLPKWVNLTSNDFVDCPSGTISHCPNGGNCTITGQGTASCTPNPKAFCDEKVLGLYCDPGWPKPSPSWPDRYVECPSSSADLCPEDAPKCRQQGTTVRCVQEVGDEE